MDSGKAIAEDAFDLLDQLTAYGILPQEADLKLLPLPAMAVYGGRCARRARPIYAAALSAEQKKLVRELDDALDLADRQKTVRNAGLLARIDRTLTGRFFESIGELMGLLRAAFKIHTNLPLSLKQLPPGPMCAAIAAFMAGSSAQCQKFMQSDSMTRSTRDDLARMTAQISYLSLLAIRTQPDPATEMTVTRYCAATWQDFDRIRQCVRDSEWNDTTKITTNDFGPLWPSGNTDWPNLDKLSWEELRARITDVRSRSLPVDVAIASLECRSEDVTRVLKPIAEQFQKDLLALVGKTFGSLEANQRVTALIQETASRLQLAFECQKEGCHQPAKLRCRSAPRQEAGVFQFDHVIDGKQTNHGAYPSLPFLKLVPPPPDRRKRPWQSTEPKATQSAD